jgi:hypothetical protein
MVQPTDKIKERRKGALRRAKDGESWKEIIAEQTKPKMGFSSEDLVGTGRQG